MKVAKEVCTINSKDRLQKFITWVNATIVENNLKEGQQRFWLEEHPAERIFMFKAKNGDVNSRKIMCDIFDQELDQKFASGDPLPWAEGYFKRSGVTCAPGYHEYSSVFCEIGDGKPSEVKVDLNLE